MAEFALFDMNNLAFRAVMAGGAPNPSDAGAIAMATCVRSMRLTCEKLATDHAVACFDARSWRRSVLPEYKATRGAGDDQAAVDVRANVIAALARLQSFLHQETNVTTLRVDGCEADDVIARWVAIHQWPQDHSYIVSNDSDFKQLVGESASIFDGTRGVLHRAGRSLVTDQAVKKSDPHEVIAGKKWLRLPDTVDPSWELFKKVMVGDKGDNVSRAAPPRTLTRVLEEAHRFGPSGLAWQNLMASRRKDLPGEPLVGEVYERNLGLIDLSRIPPDVSAVADEAIATEAMRPPRRAVGMKFLMFCNAEGMSELGAEAERYMPLLNSKYPYLEPI